MSSVARQDGIAGTLCINAVGIDPEAEAHVRVSHKASDSTTRHVLVLVHVTVAEGHGSLAEQQVNVDELHSSRGTSCRIGEHEMKAM